MVELTVGDLLRWKPSELNLVGDWDEQAVALESEFSWAVCIRSTPPVLPALRGKELVIVPAAALRELERQESIPWETVAGHLRALPIAAVVTDHLGLSSGLEGLVVIEVSTGDSALETTLNREFTERRGDLYQLGTDLARTFSAASIGGADLDSFLGLATRRVDISMALLVLTTGRVLASSEPDRTFPLDVLGTEPAGSRVSADGRDWIMQPVSGAGLPEGVVLVASLDQSEPADRARLALEQSGEALGLMFDRLPPIEAPDTRDEASEILTALATSGRLSVSAERRLTQIADDIDVTSTLRVIAGPDKFTDLLPAAALPFSVDGHCLAFVAAATYVDLGAHGDTGLIASRPFTGLENLPIVVAETLAARRLSRNGIVAAGGLDLGRPGSGGALGALLAAGAVGGDAQQPLSAYSQALLGDLDRYDRAREMQLVETLGAFLDAGGVVSLAASGLGIHRNTLAYRIARISDVSGHDLADPAVRFDLQLAIAIRRLQSA